MSEANFTFDQTDAKAKKLGCEVTRPTDKELFIDIDSDEAFAEFNEQWPKLQEHFPGVMMSWKISKSGEKHKKHIIVLMPCSVTPLERVCLQAVLGSDKLRELLAFISLKKNPEYDPTCFFEFRRSKTIIPPENKNIYGSY